MSSQTPRPPHPPPASPAIARVLPMVPEVSLFLHGQTQPTRPRLPTSPPCPRPPPSSGLAQPARPHLPSAGQAQPPHPHLPPSHHLLPQSDLSRQFHRSEATLYLSCSSDIPGRRVQFLPDSEATQPQPAEYQQDGYQPGQADRMSFPHQVQPFPHHAIQQHELVQPLPRHAFQQHEQVQPLPHNADQQHEQVQPLPHRSVQKQEQVQLLPNHAVQQNVQVHSYQHHPVHQQSPPSHTQHCPSPTVSTPQLPTTIHPDIMNVLTWQNDQLAKLQDQVARLLAASPQGSAQHVGQHPPGQAGHPAVPAPTHQPEEGSSPMLKRASSPPTSKMSVSTSTSTLWPDIQSAMVRLSEDRESLSSPQPGVCLDLPDYPTTPSNTSSGQQRVSGDMNRWDSPVLGESVSMYEGNTSSSDKVHENVEEMYENILGQVKRLLAQDNNNQQQEPKNVVVVNSSYTRQEHPPPVITRQDNLHPITRQDSPPHISRQEANKLVPQQEDYPVSAPPAQSTTTVTWERLRQLGVSFISPSDLAPSAAISSNPYNSVYLPQANIPSTSIFSPSPDTSLAMNNLALKYLSDAELGRLAAQHSRQAKTATVQTARPAEYSLASHQFLARYGLGAGQADGQGHGGAGHADGQGHGGAGYADGQRHGGAGYAGGTIQIFQQHNPNQVQVRPEIHQPHQPRLPTPQTTPHTYQARPAATDMVDRVLDITAIRQQSKLW